MPSRFILRVLAVISSFAGIADGEEQIHTWQIGWKAQDIKGYLAPFRATTSQARVRLAMATTGDPTIRHWLDMRTSTMRPISYPVDFGETGSPDSVYAQGLYHASVGFFAQANLMDVMSSYKRLELNPILAGRNGRFDATSIMRKGLLVGSLLGVQMLLVHRHPRSMRTVAIANFISTAVLGVVLAHNYSLPTGPARPPRP